MLELVDSHDFAEKSLLSQLHTSAIASAALQHVRDCENDLAQKPTPSPIPLTEEEQILFIEVLRRKAEVYDKIAEVVKMTPAYQQSAS
jgi:hypothetical protein